MSPQLLLMPTGCLVLVCLMLLKRLKDDTNQLKVIVRVQSNKQYIHKLIDMHERIYMYIYTKIPIIRMYMCINA